jgi:acyl-CoA synthetase (AMP-forming)/AMP-acid ligase II
MTLDLVSHRNLADAFIDRVAAYPDRTAVTIYRGSAADAHDSVTFAELARRAERRAAALAARLAPGERVLIALPTCLEFVELYLGCLLAGLVAVPAPVPGGSTQAGERVAAIVDDCAPGLAVTTRADRAAVAERLHVPVVEAVDVQPDTEYASVPGDRMSERDALAVLQYSSGSTGAPRGVMLTHGNILANLEAFRTDADLGPDDRLGSWLPLHHDMGLFGLLNAALLLGAPLVLMPPADFVRRPVEWFRMMDRYGVTMTAAPNFAFDLCLRLVQDHMVEGVDLSRLRVAFNGSEPIHVPTVTAFTKRFASIGLAPDTVSAAYGLAEATVFVATNPAGARSTVLVVDPGRLESVERPELTVTSGGEGKEIIGVTATGSLEIRVVDPATRRELPDGAVGEIWVRGPSIGLGYWNKPELSAGTFGAELNGAAASGGWLRTGDLGGIVGGDLFVTGRLKELLIVRGRNIFPQDVEQEARAAHPALVGFVGAAFGVAAPDERIVLVHEVSPTAQAAELPAVAAAVTKRLTVALGVPVRNVVLVRRGTVRRTTSGKVRRTEMRERFLAGAIEALHTELEPGVSRLSADGAA